MQYLADAYQYYIDNQPRFWAAAGRHLSLSLVALAISIVVCVPLGIWIARRASVAQYIINVFSALRLIPSMAILFLALPYLRTGFYPSLVALTVLACNIVGDALLEAFDPWMRRAGQGER